MNARTLVSLLLTALLALSCRSTRQDRSVEEPKTGNTLQIPRPASDPARQIPPSVCRIVATVVAVDSVVPGTGADDPCSHVPCRATVRIDTVLGYGSAFPRPLSPGQLVRVRFTFTLAPTATVLPSVSPPYPGLSTGSRFKADLEGTPSKDQPAGEESFVVGPYELQ